MRAFSPLTVGHCISESARFLDHGSDDRTKRREFLRGGSQFWAYRQRSWKQALRLVRCSPVNASQPLLRTGLTDPETMVARRLGRRYPLYRRTISPVNASSAPVLGVSSAGWISFLPASRR